MSLFDSQVLDLCCDSVEFCDYSSLENICAIGNYQLENANSQAKIGGIHLFEIQSNKSSDSKSENTKLNKISFIDTPPILDLKWINIQSRTYLTCCTSIGTVENYELQNMTENKTENENGTKLKLKKMSAVEIEKDVICLSLDWNAKNELLCATSISDGSIAILDCNQCSKDSSFGTISAIIKCHSDQVWITAFDKHHEHILYSGADDCIFNVLDLRVNYKPIHSDSQTHMSGVCSIASHSSNVNWLLTGSYDEYLRLWDKRQWKQPLSEIKFNDGVWRIKWCKHKLYQNLAMVACMRDHFQIISISDSDSDSCDLQSIVCYDGHAKAYESKSKLEIVDEERKETLEILAYGCDWRKDSTTIVSCSFYDKQVHCWSANNL